MQDKLLDLCLSSQIWYQPACSGLSFLVCRTRTVTPIQTGQKNNWRNIWECTWTLQTSAHTRRVTVVSTGEISDLLTPEARLAGQWKYSQNTHSSQQHLILLGKRVWFCFLHGISFLESKTKGLSKPLLHQGARLGSELSPLSAGTCDLILMSYRIPGNQPVLPCRQGPEHLLIDPLARYMEDHMSTPKNRSLKTTYKVPPKLKTLMPLHLKAIAYPSRKEDYGDRPAALEREAGSLISRYSLISISHLKQIS